MIKRFLKATVFAFYLSIFVVGCAQPEATPAPTQTPLRPTETATAVPTQTPTLTPSPLPTATLTPTPAPLTPADIFEKVAPVVAFVETSAGSGSGVLVEGRYVLTNAHVVWPFETVRLVFADGSEFEEAPVFNVDLMADLAVIGPIDTELAPVPLVNGEDQVIGSDVYLIGYPGEVEEYPQPTFTRGLISRLREWEGVGITYFQSDATIAGGQSGGVLVDENADVIGISGFYFTEAGFAVVASAADIWPRAQALMAGEDASGLGEWRLPTGKGRTSSSVILDGNLDETVFILHESVGTEIELELSGAGDNEAFFTLTDVYGSSLIFGRASSPRSSTATTELDAPHFVLVYQDSRFKNYFNLRSNVEFSRFEDPDGAQSLVVGKTINGRMHYPGDVDYYLIYLEAGQTVNIQADSILIDPLVGILPSDYPSFEYGVYDDDSGGGIFGLNAELTYQTPQSGFYMVSVESSYGYETGGYILTLDTPYPGAPTPIIPTATPRPHETDLGLMTLYTNAEYNFSFEYPGEWTAVREYSPSYDICQRFTACFESFRDSTLLAVTIEDLSHSDRADMTTDEYVDDLTEFLTENELSITSREELMTNDGLKLTVLSFESGDEETFLFAFKRAIYLHDGLAYNITYWAPDQLMEDLEPIVEYSFKSFKLE